MRIAAFVVALLGVAASGLLGIKWLTDFSVEKSKPSYKQYVELGRELAKTDPEMKKKFELLDGMVRTAYAFVACAGIGLVAAVLVLKRQGLIGGVTLLVCGVVPVVFDGDPKMVLFTSLLLIAGILALFVRKKRPPTVPAPE